MPGEAEVLRMFDFFYSQTHYRRHEQLNHLVSDGARQIASGIPGEEYVVYDEDGGSITIDLSEADGKLSVVWYDPKTGKYSDATTVSGGGSRTFDAPFDGDAVLHIQSMTEQRPGFTAHTYLPLTISR
jgi:hypothetical protein